MDKKNRMSRQQFISEIAEKNGVTAESLMSAYNMIFDGICDVVKSGKRLCLNGFGSFYLQKHKGHRMQFSNSAKSEDYIVFKFSAANTLNQKFRDEVKIKNKGDS